MLPQPVPARQLLAAALAGEAALAGAVREHVGAQAAHVTEHAAAARAVVLPGGRERGNG